MMPGYSYYTVRPLQENIQRFYRVFGRFPESAVRNRLKPNKGRILLWCNFSPLDLLCPECDLRLSLFKSVLKDVGQFPPPIPMKTK